MYNQRSLKKFGDGIFKALVIEKLNQDTETTNELFDAIFKRDTPKTGLEKLHFNDVKGLKTRLEDSLLDRILEKVANVQDIKFTMIHPAPEVKSQLIEFAAQLIE